MKITKVVINTDGGARGNPGPAGCGVVIKDEFGAMLFAEGFYLGEATNNVAEYKGLLFALEKAQELGATELEIRMDSELIVKQMKGEYKIKEPTLKVLAQQVKNLLATFTSFSFTHVRREHNSEADKLVNLAIDTHIK